MSKKTLTPVIVEELKASLYPPEPREHNVVRRRLICPRPLTDGACPGESRLRSYLQSTDKQGGSGALAIGRPARFSFGRKKMKNAITAPTFLLLLLLTSCGKECKPRTELVSEATSVRLEELKCPAGQQAQPPIVTKHLLNGDVVGYWVACVKVVSCGE